MRDSKLVRGGSTFIAAEVYEREYTNSIQKLARMEFESTANKKLKTHRSNSRQLKLQNPLSKFYVDGLIKHNLCETNAGLTMQNFF